MWLLIFFGCRINPVAGNPTTVITIDPQNVDYLLRGKGRLLRLKSVIFTNTTM